MSAGYHTPLDDEHPTIAEVLSSRGYSTAGFVANLGYCGAATGLARGFVHYEDYPVSIGQVASSATLTRTFANNFRLRRLLQNDQHMNRKSADMLNRDVLDWIDNQSRPFFIFVNYFDAHDPYLPPPPFDTRFGPGRQHGRHSPLHHWLYNRALGHTGMDARAIQEEIDAYDGAIAYLDDRLNELFTALRDRSLWENTLVVITSDHGEEFGEHGVFEHSYSLYRPSVHVPLILSFPARAIPGTRVQTPVSLRDLPATILELTGIGSEAAFPGDSLTRYWTRQDSAGEIPLRSDLQYASGQPEWFPVSKGDMKSVLFDGRRYIRNGDGSEELYDFHADAWETRNLASAPENRNVMERFRAIVAEGTSR
jgi:arylsulfatase A-like enzyme